MSHALPALLLGVCTILGLLLVPLGLPGLWVMVAGIVGYGWLTDFRSVGVATIGTVLGLAFLGEIVEWWLGFRLARTFGGSRRSAWRPGRRDRRRRAGRARADRRERDRRVPRLVRRRGPVRVFAVPHNRDGGASGVGRRGGTRGSRRGEDRAGYRDRRIRSVRRTARLSGAGRG